VGGVGTLKEYCDVGGAATDEKLCRPLVKKF